MVEAGAPTDPREAALAALMAAKGAFDANPAAVTQLAVLHAVGVEMVVDVPTLPETHAILTAAVSWGVIALIADADLYETVYGAYRAVVGWVTAARVPMVQAVLTSAWLRQLLYFPDAHSLAGDLPLQVCIEESRERVSAVVEQQVDPFRAGQELYANVSQLRESLDEQ